MTQEPVPEQPPPDQPTKVAPCSGCSKRNTRPAGTLTEQMPPNFGVKALQLSSPPGSQTVPSALPAITTLKVTRGCGSWPPTVVDQGEGAACAVAGTAIAASKTINRRRALRKTPPLALVQISALAWPSRWPLPTRQLYDTHSVKRALQHVDNKAHPRQSSCLPMARSAPTDPSLGAALRQLREARDLSQEGASHAANITLGAYGKIERNEVAPAWATVRSIAKGFGITMKELGEAVDRLD